MYDSHKYILLNYRSLIHVSINIILKIISLRVKILIFFKIILQYFKADVTRNSRQHVIISRTVKGE